MAKMRKEYDPNKVMRRKRRPIIYIICEGKETETLYFKHFRSRNCLVDIIPISSKHKAAEHLVKVKRDLYVVISLETKQPVLSRYQIGSQLYPDATISHHSAFETFGYANQVFYDVYVETKSKFKDFEYDGIWYHHMTNNIHKDVVVDGKLRVTGIEQTIVDSIKDFRKVAGLEEVIRCIMLVPGVKEDKILKALSMYNNMFLYQKCGYILEQLQDELGLSDNFFKSLRIPTVDSKRYLIKENGQNVWNPKWKLYVPVDFMHLINKGVGNYNAI